MAQRKPPSQEADLLTAGFRAVVTGICRVTDGGVTAI